MLRKSLAVVLLVSSFAPRAASAEWIGAAEARASGIRFVQADGSVDRAELGRFASELRQRRAEVEANVASNARRKGGDDEAVAKKLRKNKTLGDFDLILGWTEELGSARRPGDARVTLSRRITEAELALKSDLDPVNTLRMYVEHVKVWSHKVAISRAEAPLGEAKNLVDPRTGRIFTAARLAELKARGADLSKFDPPKDNGVLELLDVSRTSPRERYVNARNPLHEGLTVWYPEKNEFQFDEIRKKQSRPKLTVFARDARGKKTEYKLKLAMELHGETTSAALSSALGIYHDLGRYARDVKVSLGKTTFDEFRLDWNSYYMDYDLDRLIKKRGRDENGDYIVFIEGLLEAELDEDVLRRIGPWYWGAADHKFRREFRGLLLFDVWIHNTDIKEGENNKLVLKRRADGGRDFYYLQQDLGFSFGRLFREKPHDYSWNVVDSAGPAGVTLDYRIFQPNSGFGHVTWADARWMVRKIARLSRRQIEEAVAIGRWPDRAPYDYRSLITEKLIARRNQLVRAFELEGEVQPDGSRIERLRENRAVESRAIPAGPAGVPGRTVDFAPEIKSNLVDPVLRILGEKLRDGTLKITSSVDHIGVEPSWFGWDRGVVSEALVSLNRTVVQNPKPKHSGEAFLVRDDFALGARLGYGFVLSGDLSYVRGFSLIYPVATRELGFKGRPYLADVLRSGYEHAEKSLPSGHVLIVENAIEGRGKLSLDGDAAVSLGFDATAGRTVLTRSLISRKGLDKITFVEDRTDYGEIARKIYTKLAFFKISHYKRSLRVGTTEQDVYEVSAEDSRLANDVLFANDFALIRGRGKHGKLTTSFWTRNSKINIFGLWQREKELRRDFVDIWRLGKDGKATKHGTKLVVEMSAQETQPIIPTGEDHRKQVRFTSEIDARGNMVEPLLKLTFVHADPDVTNLELETGYLPFIDGVAGRRNFLNFTPSLHSYQKGYSELNVKTEIEIYRPGIERLFRMDEGAFRRAFMARLGLPGPRLDRILPADQRSGDGVAYFGKTYSYTEMEQAAERFLRYFAAVRSAKGLTAKSEALVVALYKAATASGPSYQPIVFRAIADIVGPEGYFLEARISPPGDVENKLPGKVDPYNRAGTRRKIGGERDKFLFDMSEAVEVYRAL